MCPGMRGLVEGLAAMIRVEAVWLCTEPMDMRDGTGTTLARVVQVFGSARPAPRLRLRQQALQPNSSGVMPRRIARPRASDNRQFRWLAPGSIVYRAHTTRRRCVDDPRQDWC